MDLDYEFNIETMPFKFGDLQDELVIKSGVHEMISALNKDSPYHFILNNSRKTDTVATFKYFRSQDQAREKTGKVVQRDSRRMARFPCESSLSVKIDIEAKSLEFQLSHIAHEPYKNTRSLPPSVLEYINEHCIKAKSPSDLYDDLIAQPKFRNLSFNEQQVYYHWRKANCGLWTRDKDAYISTRMLLPEYASIVEPLEFDAENVRAIGFIVEDTRKRLAVHSKEVAMDANYGTSNAGLDLFAVLVEFDGTGIPLAYLFLEVCSVIHYIK